MRDMMLRQHRDYELFLAYQEALESNEFNNQREAVDYVRRSPAPKWFVSKEFCAAVLSSLLRGKDHYKMGKQKKRKFAALLELYNEKKKEFPYCGMCHLALCEAIVEMPAPEWYLGYEMAAKIINEQIKERNERIARRYAR
jgi:hypothetical protein